MDHQWIKNKSSKKAIKIPKKYQKIIDGLENDFIELKNKNVRLLAEFDNYKRRTQEERSRLFKYAGEDLAKAILPILDDLHRTLESDGKGKARTILEGIELIVSKLDKTSFVLWVFSRKIPT